MRNHLTLSLGTSSSVGSRGNSREEARTIVMACSCRSTSPNFDQRMGPCSCVHKNGSDDQSAGLSWSRSLSTCSRVSLGVGWRTSSSSIVSLAVGSGPNANLSGNSRRSVNANAEVAIASNHTDLTEGSSKYSNLRTSGSVSLNVGSDEIVSSSRRASLT